ncbi:MAG: antirestriction protein ArdA [Clostridium sp.]|nr:antirestriction protein ArdA [Clostridium sp.]
MDEAIERCDDISAYYDCVDMTDVAYQVVDMVGGVEHMDKEILERYFDYESYGRDMDINGQFVFLDDGICVELLNY